MLLLIVSVGTRMPAWVDEGFTEYAKRVPPESRIELREIKAEPRVAGRTPDELMRAEGLRIRSAIPKRSVVVALDERGIDINTVALAAHLQRWQSEGKDVTWIIGGPDGIEPGLKSEATLRLRLSSLTLPHAMVRVLLAEQLYRAWSINQNHPYHRA